MLESGLGAARARCAPRAARSRAGIDAALEDLVSAPALRPFLSDTGVQRRGGRRVLAVKTRSAGRVPGLVARPLAQR